MSTQPAQKMEPPPQARKLLDAHMRALDVSVEEAARKVSSPGAVLTAACALLSQRQRYFGATGEHFSVQEYDGIQIIDQLDERMLRNVRALVRGYLDRAGKAGDPRAVELLAAKLAPGAKELPQYPVGYMVHYMLVSAVQAFEPVVEEGHGFERGVLEIAMLHHVMAILDKYLQTREKPVTRHFSDVAREHTVVTRLKCVCGAEKFEVKLQALCQTPAGEPFDRLDLKCKDCGHERSITFDLPYFKDMYQL
jgi:hypothetical protein